MTALGRLIRTTAFKLSLVYLTVFAVFAACLLAYFAWNTQRLLTEQITQTIDAEINGLAEQYRIGGIRRLVSVVESRSLQPGSNLYLVASFSGEALAGNVAALAPGVLDRPGRRETIYRRLDEEGTERPALVRIFQLPAGFRVLVGRDLEERRRVQGIVRTAATWSAAFVVLMGLTGGFFVTRRVLKRVDAMTQTTQTIMAGNLSGRLPMAGTNDEFDRLASNLNAMLERIEALMRGLKEVSDNIAHDLKTPLTRLRNRCEAALRTGRSESDFRATIEATIEESDALIRTFNALLLIARAESGQAREGWTEFDAAELVRDVSELYEPLADESGALLDVDATASPIKGHRELLSQAVANLIDNAIKYSASQPSQEGRLPSRIAVGARQDGDTVRLSVADSGPGIPEADRARAVSRFVRLEQSRSRPGSGLGLSLAAAVARLHGGELTLDDNTPGLRVTIVLPVQAPKSAPSPTARSAITPVPDTVLPSSRQVGLWPNAQPSEPLPPNAWRT